jgi:hypothetical protein
VRIAGRPRSYSGEGVAQMLGAGSRSASVHKTLAVPQFVRGPLSDASRTLGPVTPATVGARFFDHLLHAHGQGSIAAPSSTSMGCNNCDPRELCYVPTLCTYSAGTSGQR